MKKVILKLIERTGYKLVKKGRDISYQDIQDEEFWKIYNLCKPYTMTSIERMYSLYKAVEYILTNEIEGVFVECGVWRGGSVMLIAQMLSNRNLKDRKIYLYDTFTGMSEPTEKDVSFGGDDAQVTINEKGFDENQNSKWCYADLRDVKNNLSKTNFVSDNFIFFKGKVEDTIPSNIPEEKIALLRLDTDWYESTKHELIFLFPKITINGVLIIDDYGYWKGCRKAVDEYFAENKLSVLLNRIDNTGRIAIKTDAKT